MIDFAILAPVPEMHLRSGQRVARELPDAILQWIGDAFGLKPDYETGAELELPGKALTRFEIASDVEVADDDLVRVRVICPGWQRKGEALLRPRVKPANHEETL